MSDKTLIFLSHVSEEAEIAKSVKQCIEDCFFGMVDVFVSSDRSTVGAGDNWLNRITGALRTAKAMLVVCSPASVSRPWINFEAGAGWAREIPILPLCHSGLRPVDLPLPLNLLQGVQANDPESLEDMIALIAAKVECKMPKFDLEPLANKIRKFEETYLVAMSAASPLNSVKTSWPELFQEFVSCNDGTIALQGVQDWKVNLVRQPLEVLQSRELITYSYRQNQIHFTDDPNEESGYFGDLTIRMDKKLIAYVRRIK